MTIQCLIFVEGDKTPQEFNDIDVAVSKAVMLYENGIAFDVVPASCGYLTQDRKISSLGQDFRETDHLSPTELNRDAKEQIDIWVSNRLRMHYNPETGKFGPRQYRAKYDTYMQRVGLHEQYAPPYQDGPHVKVYTPTKLFPAPGTDIDL